MYLEIEDFIIRDYGRSYFVLVHKAPVKNPKSPRFGQLKEKEVGYFPNLEMALNELKDNLIAQSNVDTAEALLCELQNIGRMITEAVKRVTDSA